MRIAGIKTSPEMLICLVLLLMAGAGSDAAGASGLHWHA
jgi:hypothetical protein